MEMESPGSSEMRPVEGVPSIIDPALGPGPHVNPMLQIGRTVQRNQMQYLQRTAAANRLRPEYRTMLRQFIEVSRERGTVSIFFTH